MWALTIDDKSGDLVEASAANSIVDNALNPRIDANTIRQPDTSKEDPRVAAVVSQYVTQAAPLANRVLGTITADIRSGREDPSGTNAAGEQPMGDVIADAMLEATTPTDRVGAMLTRENPAALVRREGKLVGIVSRYDVLQQLIGTR